jgi:hypothetical protein
MHISSMSTTLTATTTPQTLQAALAVINVNAPLSCMILNVVGDNNNTDFTVIGDETVSPTVYGSRLQSGSDIFTPPNSSNRNHIYLTRFFFRSNTGSQKIHVTVQVA